MAHLFCSECGSKNIYTLSKPKFCQSCGNSFVMASHVSKAKASFSNSHEQAEESLPDITKLQYEINIGKNNVNLGSLLDNPMNPNDVSYNKGNIEFKKISQNEYLSLSTSECASSKTVKHIEGE